MTAGRPIIGSSLRSIKVVWPICSSAAARWHRSPRRRHGLSTGCGATAPDRLGVARALCVERDLRTRHEDRHGKSWKPNWTGCWKHVAGMQREPSSWRATSNRQLWLFTFLHCFGLDATNNGGRAIRGMVIAQGGRGAEPGQERARTKSWPAYCAPAGSRARTLSRAV